jgi:hypothetical protein
MQIHRPPRSSGKVAGNHESCHGHGEPGDQQADTKVEDVPVKTVILGEVYIARKDESERPVVNPVSGGAI